VTPAKKTEQELVGIDLVKAALLDPNVKLSIVDEDPEVVQRRMIERTLGAEKVEDLWDSGVTHAKDAVGRAFTLRSVEFRNSDVENQEGGLSIFAVMHVAFRDTGEVAVITCGATGVVTRLVKLIEFDALPIDVKIRETQTNRGYKVMDLEPAAELFS
jgi:hypothetical protein